MLINPREAAYQALLTSHRHDAYASDYLEEWRKTAHPSDKDFRLAQEIAYGTIRMAFALDYMAEQLTDKGKLSLKPKERLLMRSALYQHLFLTRIPLYALVNESVDLARKYCHSTFVGFLNATLRKLSDVSPVLPAGDSAHALSIRYSYPQYFVENLLEQYGLDTTVAILEAGNSPAFTLVRLRNKGVQIPPYLTRFGENTLMARLEDSAHLSEVIDNPQFYIQNITPAALIQFLSEGLDEKPPKCIVDLCAAPGGKLIAIHDRFPDASLHANDVSKQKVKVLEENIAKYGLNIHITCLRGEEYQVEEHVDIVILDAPCSNSGVLNKRPEARWRLSEESLYDQVHLQKKLLESAASLIKPEGEIWYMTCSILRQENQELVQWATQHLGLRVKKEKAVLPNIEGWDGGYAAALVHRSFSM